MLQSMGLQRVRHDLVTEQQHQSQKIVQWFSRAAGFVGECGMTVTVIVMDSHAG